jgi:hypothetical protein
LDVTVTVCPVPAAGIVTVAGDTDRVALPASCVRPIVSAPPSFGVRVSVAVRCETVGLAVAVTVICQAYLAAAPGSPVIATPEVMPVQVVPSVEIFGLEILNPVPVIANVNLVVFDIPVTVLASPAFTKVSTVSLPIRIFPAADCVTVTVLLVAPLAAMVSVEERVERPVCVLAPVVNVPLPVPLAGLTVFHDAFAIIFFTF